jgi:hypothetical protein
VPVNFYSSATVGSLNLLVDVPPGHLTDFALLALVPQIDVTSVSITPQGGATSLIHLNTLSGQSLSGAQQIAQLGFRAISNVPSAFVPLRVTGAAAAKPDASPVNVASVQSGRAVVIGLESLLEAFQTNGTRTLVLYGKPMSTFAMQYTTNLADLSAWITASPPVVLTSFSTAMSPPGGNLNPVFYRAMEVPAQPPGVQLAWTSNGTLQLTLTGRTGVSYAIQYTTSLSPPIHWTAWTNVTLVGSVLQLTLLPPPPAFFRALELPPGPPPRLVALVNTNGTRQLQLYGMPGADHGIWYTPSLSPPINWTLLYHVTPDASVVTVPTKAGDKGTAFYRAVRF